MRLGRSVLAAVVASVLAVGCAPGPQYVPGPLPAGVSPAGKWNSNWGKMVLVQTGDVVSGTFEHKNGKLQGRIDGDVLLFEWSQPRNRDAGQLAARGKGWLRVSQDGEKLSGAWGYQDLREGGGRWTAERDHHQP